MRKILITGGLGYVGGRLAQELSKSNVVILSSRNEPPAEAKALLKTTSFLKHDSLLSPTSFPEDIDVVIHLAALNEIDSVQQPDLAIEVNINQTRKILENAITRRVKRFIYFSTIHVYGKSLAGEIDEQTLPRPTHPYAITHRAAEDYVIAANDQGKINGIVVRLSNSFGTPILPNVNRWTLLVNDICRQAVTTRQIKLSSNGCQYRDFVTLNDVTAATKFLLSDSTANGIYNLSSGVSMPVMKMAELVQRAAEKTVDTHIPISLPEGSNPTQEIFYVIKSKRLTEAGFITANHFEDEIDQLAGFCKKYFGS
ncbi:MAG: SDR family oxidoreductase [Bacteroidetes bacterium]|nr:SDR family oxidoreductase [Bacteroidota bacterium]